MYKVIYYTEINDYCTHSLPELFNHVRASADIYNYNPYDGDYIHRLIYVHDFWIHDNDFLIKINVVNGGIALSAVQL